jgi:hypothetical protein
MGDLGEHLFHALESFHGEEVARDIEWVDAGIVRRAETGVDEADSARGVAVAFFAERVVRRFGFALEVVRAA